MKRWGTVAGGLAGVLVTAVAALLVGFWVADVAEAGHSSSTCAKCHVPHRAGLTTDANASWGVPLWNISTYKGKNVTNDGEATFTLYSSDTFTPLATDISQPDGASKLCLGCHDGTYVSPTSRSAFSAAEGLRRSHPISFTYDTGLASRNPRHSLRDPASALSGLGGTIQQDLLDSHGKMQCTSCHDVHAQGLEYMLRFEWDPAVLSDNTFCRVCHNK
jgi:hypothetical protein